MERKEYESLDILKFVMAILIVSLHVGPFLSISRPADFLLNQTISRTAVPCFFTISGFLLFSKLENIEDKKVYFKAYIERIIKIYMIWTAIYIPTFIIEFYFNSVRFNAIDCVLTLVHDILVKGIYRLWYLHALVIGAYIVYMLKYRLKLCNYGILGITGGWYAIGVLTTSWSGAFSGFPLFKCATVQTLINAYLFVFETTRNGFFFGSFFIAIGMVIINCETNIAKKRYFLRTILWYVVLVFEAYLLHQREWSTDYSMMFALVPVTYYLIRLVLLLDCKNIGVAKHLRNLSTLVYLVHPLLILFLSFVGVYSGEFNSICVFCIVLFATLALSECLICASKKYRWIKSFY